MATKSFFTIRLGEENISVQGWKLSPRFACRIENGFGYRITHTPTGHLLTTMGFATTQGAKVLADAVESIMDKQLDQTDPIVLNHSAKIDPTQTSILEVIKKLDQLSKTKKIMDDMEISAWIGAMNGQ